MIYKLTFFRVLSDLNDLENDLQGQSHKNKKMLALIRWANRIICTIKGGGGRSATFS
jgi:hypothetical protein